MTVERQSWRLFATDLGNQRHVVALSEDEHHYAHHVLRLREGDPVEVGNCAGLVGYGRVASSDKRGTTISLTEFRNFPGLRPGIHLVVGMPKQSALDELVSLCAEVGAGRMTLVATERSQNRNPPRFDRLEKVARETMRITKSAWQLKMDYQKHLVDELLLVSPETALFLCDESPIYESGVCCHNHLASRCAAVGPDGEIRLFIGPEASFSNGERERIRAAGAVPVSLGDNILRVPTAAAVASAIAVAFAKGR
jgi:16S rRNA (uracil1498-N3)-methyltransferase